MTGTELLQECYSTAAHDATTATSSYHAVLDVSSGNRVIKDDALVNSFDYDE